LTVPVGSIEYQLKHEMAYRVLVGKPGGKRALGKPRHRWEDNTKMHFTFIVPCIITIVPK